MPLMLRTLQQSVLTATMSAVSARGLSAASWFSTSSTNPRSSREQNWVASGSFDRTIRLWDLGQPPSQAKHDPLITLSPPDSSGPKSSVYAMAVDPFGHTIVSGGPERVVRIWDPRSGKRTTKLVGHTDNIRAIIISEDSRYVRHFVD